MYKSVKDQGERVKRPLVRLAQPVVIKEEKPIPVDNHRKTKVVLFCQGLFIGRISKENHDTVDSDEVRRAEQSPFVKAVPVYRKRSLMRQIHKNIQKTDHFESAECLTTSSWTRKAARLEE